MLGHFIELLQADDFYNTSEALDLAKGKRHLPSSWQGIKNYTKRNKLWPKR